MYPILSQKRNLRPQRSAAPSDILVMARVRNKVPLDKRKRVTIACTECRRRRVKCNGAIPCENCKRKGYDCCLEAPTAKEREITDPTYLLQLERLVLYRYPRFTAKDLRKNINFLERSVAADEVYEPTEEAAKLPVQMAATSDQSFITFMNSDPSTDEYYHKVDKISKSLLFESMALLPPLTRMEKLAHVFFNVCETNFFYLHPQRFFQQVTDLYANTSNLLYVNSHWETLVHVLGVLSIASNFEYIQDGTEAPSSKETVLWDDPGYNYYLQMLHFVGFCIQNNNLESIQTFQLMGVYMTTKRVDVLSRCVDHGYRYLSMAVEIAISNKFYLESSLRGKSPAEKELIRRLWWSSYCLERRLGLNLGKPELLKWAAIDVLLPQENCDLDHVDGTSNWDSQRAMIDIMSILNDISAMVYNSNNDTSVTVQTKTVREISFKLDQWKQKVEESRKMQSELELELKYRANKHLDLFFYLGKIYLGKPFLLYQLENHVALDNDNPQNTFIHYMTSVCVDSAFNIFNILTQMKDDNKLGLYSCTDLNFVNVGLFVTVSFLKIDSSPSTVIFLNKGLDILKKLASSSAKVNRSMFSKFDNLAAKDSQFAVNRGAFPDWDVDIYAPDFGLYGMGTLMLPNYMDGSSSGYNVYDDLCARFLE